MLGDILRVEHLKKYFVKKSVFGSSTSIVKAADDVSFSVGKGEVFVLAGESGSGKSTIAKTILGSVRPDSGKVFFDGGEIRTDNRSLQRIRTNCQMIHQDPYDSINPRMKIAGIIAEPLEIHRVGNKDERTRRVMSVLGEVKLEPAGEIAEKYPHMLSGGQRQRVVLARALALHPKIIFADEPVSMLDVSVRAEMLELMHELQIKHDISFVYITHDLATARYFGQRIGILYRGRIVEMGRIDEVLFNPRHPYTQALTDAISHPDPANLHATKKIRIVDDNVHTGTGGNSSSVASQSARAGAADGCRFAPRCPYVISECSREPDLSDVKTGHYAACHVNLELRRDE